MKDDLTTLRGKLYCGAFHGLPTNELGLVELGKNPLETILKTAGATLTREECRTLWQILTGRRRKFLPSGRKLDPDIDDRDKAASWLVALYKANGKLPKNAIEDVIKCYGMKRSQVYAACKRYPHDTIDFDPTILPELIAMYESKKFPTNTWTKIL